jgi:hypothetical protein
VELYEKARLISLQQILRPLQHHQFSALNVHPQHRGPKPGVFPYHVIQFPDFDGQVSGLQKSIVFH